MLFDGHSDLLYGFNDWHQRGEQCVFEQRYAAQFQQGGVEGGIFVLWSNPEAATPMAVQIAQQLQTLTEELQQTETLLLVHNAAEIAEAQQQNKIAVLLGAEGLDGYAQQESVIDWLYAQGVRHVGLTWNNSNEFAAGVQGVGGLTALGRKALARIQQKGMLLDVAHLNDDSLRDVLALAQEPLIASHCNSRRLCRVPRNLTDAQAKAIAALGGVIGLNSYLPFVAEDVSQQTLQRFTDHIVYFADLVGTAHIGLGLDLNYWETDALQTGAVHYGQIEQFWQLLRGRGFSEQELQQIFRENFLRMIAQRLT